MVETAGMIPEVIVVDATVAGVAEFRGKMRISLTIPVFRSDYPTNCTDFPDGMDRAVTVGDPYRVELRRQNRVPGKGDGSKPFHYYWGINGRSETPVTVFSPAATSHPSGNGRDDPTGISIERQTAYKGAIELAVARMGTGKTGMTVEMNSILDEAEKAATWIHGGPVTQRGSEVPDETPAPDGDPPPDEESAQEMFDNLGSASAPAGAEIGNLGDFMTKAQQGGHGYSAEILKKLGVSKPVEIEAKYGTFDAALKKLATP